ncbi:hypothetical protein [Campylobacter portucalensis]|uniref:hypothetical protein n=1 Tax=Campylobacter portucalensis TaxID=2608384 RepID=UPI001E4C2339|nr:hypothetical protein [Campylobacter portucalensis]
MFVWEKVKTSIVTTQEAQLIGRGARYFPFGDVENRYIRKFYVDYIENLNKSMVENGLFVELEEKRITFFK